MHCTDATTPSELSAVCRPAARDRTPRTAASTRILLMAGIFQLLPATRNSFPDSAAVRTPEPVYTYMQQEMAGIYITHLRRPWSWLVGCSQSGKAIHLRSLTLALSFLPLLSLNFRPFLELGRVLMVSPPSRRRSVFSADYICHHPTDRPTDKGERRVGVRRLRGVSVCSRLHHTRTSTVRTRRFLSFLHAAVFRSLARSPDAVRWTKLRPLRINGRCNGRRYIRATFLTMKRLYA